MQNWNAWNRIVFHTETVYLFFTDLFEIELFEHFLNWIAWNKTAFDIETVYCMLSWNVWNKSVMIFNWTVLTFNGL